MDEDNRIWYREYIPSVDSLTLVEQNEVTEVDLHILRKGRTDRTLFRDEFHFVLSFLVIPFYFRNDVVFKHFDEQSYFLNRKKFLDLS